MFNQNFFVPQAQAQPQQTSFMVYEVPLPSTLVKRIVQGVVDIIGIIIVFVAYAIVALVMKAKIRYYTCDQSDVSYPYISDTIPFYAVGIFGVLGTIIPIILIELGNARIYPFQNFNVGGGARQFAITALHALALFAFGLGTTLLITEIGKDWVGRLRPHFMAVCQPTYSTINCISTAATGSIYNPVYTGGSFCHGDSSTIENARKSFPSGHASFAFYCMVFLIVYLEARLFLLRFRFIKGLLQVTAFIAAFVTACSRIPDYQHRGSDVIGGALLGTGIALFITLMLGQVLWTYERDQPYYDFDQKPEPPLQQATAAPFVQFTQ